MNDTVLSLFHIVCQPQYETWNCLVYSLSLSYLYDAFKTKNSSLSTTKKWCDDVDLKTGYQWKNFYLSVKVTVNKKSSQEINEVVQREIVS